MINQLPQDPFMLMSFINMKLRDQYPSLPALCEDMNIKEEDITSRLSEAGFEYSKENNKFW